MTAQVKTGLIVKQDFFVVELFAGAGGLALGLEKAGFKYEGVAQSYLQINGRWRNHVLYANLRYDRRGRTDAG